MAESLEKIPEDLQRELRDAASSGGVAKLKDVIERKRNDWKKIPLNIAITGATGVGKSTFINAIRDVTADDDGSAHVDVVQGTMKAAPYPHPKNKSMVIWDLPGVGTPDFPRDSYLQKVRFEMYDFFLILSAGRFRDDDLWLAKEIQCRQKKFHFVRTQLGNDVKNDSMAHPKSHSKAKVIEKIRNDCEKQLAGNGLTLASVFLIDSYSTLDYEFGSLQTTLINEAPAHKKEAMIFSMTVLTDEVLRMKREALQKRIFKVSLASAIGGAVPIPGVGAAVDSLVLYEEIKFYKRQLGLDDAIIKEYAKRLNTEPEELKERLSLTGIKLATSPTRLIQVMTPLLAYKTFKTALPLAIPVLGAAISAGISYGMSVTTLRYFLSCLLEDARKINNEMLKHMVPSTC